MKKFVISLTVAVLLCNCAGFQLFMPRTSVAEILGKMQACKTSASVRVYNVEKGSVIKAIKGTMNRVWKLIVENQPGDYLVYQAEADSSNEQYITYWVEEIDSQRTSVSVAFVSAVPFRFNSVQKQSELNMLNGIEERCINFVEDKSSINENQKKLTSIVKNKKVAVINIAINTQGISNDITSTIIDFLINSFVNTGIVTVVDRKNISDIIKEHEFQLSDLVDENTVVRIGKLAGADIIITGSISFISGEYYLNIQLKAVISGEIIGSSITKTSSKAYFLEMCNEAVNKLF